MNDDREPDAGRDAGRPRRIVITGGPGAGKTTAVRELGERFADQLVVVPEAATLLLNGGFPRVEHEHAPRLLQQTVFTVQRNLETLLGHAEPHKVQLCDRGTVDGPGYLGEPAGTDSGFLESMGSDLHAELARYDLVLFFETAAAIALDVGRAGNVHRHEDDAAARRRDAALRAHWARHPRFHVVRARPDLEGKLEEALALVEAFLAQR